MQHSASDRVCIDVGGTMFFCTREIMSRAEPNSVFARHPPDEKGQYVFFRKPECFSIILDHMCGYRLPLHNMDNETMTLLLQDCDFYGLSNLKEILTQFLVELVSPDDAWTTDTKDKMFKEFRLEMRELLYELHRCEQLGGFFRPIKRFTLPAESEDPLRIWLCLKEMRKEYTTIKSIFDLQSRAQFCWNLMKLSLQLGNRVMTEHFGYRLFTEEMWTEELEEKLKTTSQPAIDDLLRSYVLKIQTSKSKITLKDEEFLLRFDKHLEPNIEPMSTSAICVALSGAFFAVCLDVWVRHFRDPKMHQPASSMQSTSSIGPTFSRPSDTNRYSDDDPSPTVSADYDSDRQFDESELEDIDTPEFESFFQGDTSLISDTEALVPSGEEEK